MRLGCVRCVAHWRRTAVAHGRGHHHERGQAHQPPRLAAVADIGESSVGSPGSCVFYVTRDTWEAGGWWLFSYPASAHSLAWFILLNGAEPW